MRTIAIAAALALGLVPAALAQTKSPTPSAPSSAAGDAKFKSADRNNNGSLEGAELEPFKSAMTQADTNKDGKLSQSEFTAGSKAGHIK